MMNHRALSFAVLLAATLAAGCSIHVTLEVDESGRGRTTTVISLTPQEVENLKRIPNLSSYLAAWKEALERSGIEVRELNAEAGQFVIVRAFEALGELEREQPLGGNARSWVDLRREVEPLATTWVLNAKLDTRDLIPQSLADANPAVAMELRRRLQGGVLTYEVRLPGTLLTAPGRDTEDPKMARWIIPLGEMAVIHVESRTANREARKRVAVIIGLAGLVAIGSLAWIGRLLRARRVRVA